MREYFIGIVVIIISLLVLVLSIHTLTSNEIETNTSSIQWGNDLNQAMEEAKKSNKTIFIDFYADWCSYCGDMDEETFTDPQVKEKLTQSYVLLKVDVDKNPDLSSKYRAYSLPTIVIVDSSGNEIKRIIGYQTPEQLLSQI
ncbi:MAG: thioredoxin family protein [Methanobacterium sp.]|jgi:thiol:disulfide interchange protein DsbD|uniref:thioredoxin family protein n=1 Tax=Methanobacterium sp. TaxID=2164 RepID=UPI002590FD53|nr:thioredoxin family protein [Methanobacterium sp.]MCC7559891.1 thioredoxin family protein [Methanobacterium sp.]